eukprot:g13727.t1
MSTLAAARADNMYYPPEWRPEYGGISKFQGSKGHNQYEKYGKIRFELPVHGWCLGCGRHLGRGTRFNASKEQAGTYYSTKIWQFSMKCPSCSTVMVIKTDPKNTDYEYVEGIRKKDMAFDPDETETQRVQDSEVTKKLAADPLYRLEHEQSDKRRAASRKTALTRLTELVDAHGEDDYASNARLRQGMRARKKKEREREEEATAKGLGIRLATPSPADSAAARDVKYRSRHKGFRSSEKAKMAAITGESIFGSGSESSDQARRKAVLVKAAKLGIKTRGMRLLRPGDGGGAAGRRTEGSHSLRGARSSGGSAEQRARGPDVGEGGSTRRHKRPRSSGTGGAGHFAGVGMPQGFEGDIAGAVVGGEVEVSGGTGSDDRPTARKVEVDGPNPSSPADALPSKKRRKRGSSSSKSKSSSAAAAPGSHGGLAAIASLY